MAETRFRLGSHVYQGLEFFSSLCVMSSWSITTSKSFVTKGDLMQQPLFNQDFKLKKNLFAKSVQNCEKCVEHEK